MTDFIKIITWSVDIKTNKFKSMSFESCFFGIYFLQQYISKPNIDKIFAWNSWFNREDQDKE